jgi:hypothetical protein
MRLTGKDAVTTPFTSMIIRRGRRVSSVGRGREGGASQARGPRAGTGSFPWSTAPAVSSA